VVDASQGVEAQTVANCYTALDLGVEVFAVLNKMDLPQADPENAKAEIEDVIGIDASDAIPCSAKTGMGIDEILEAIVAKVPAPKGNPDGPLRAMIVDSWFDPYVGVVMLVRVVDGELKKGERFKMMATALPMKPTTSACSPRPTSRAMLKAGEVGYIIAGIKELKAAKVGDTITLEKSCPTTWALPRSPAGLQGSQAPGVSRVCTRPKPANTTSCAMRWKSCSSTMRRCSSSPKSRRRWALASAAASWACCTWKSCRSAWSASSTRT
jgi:GTP-binding protein LepA